MFWKRYRDEEDFCVGVERGRAAEIAISLGLGIILAYEGR
jgi:hypothetical protein